MDVANFLAQSARSVLGRHTVKSAMTPIVTLCITMVLPLGFFAYLFADDPILKYTFAFSAILLPIVATGMYVYFGLWKPEKLQSEEFQVKQQIVQMVLKKAGEVTLEPISLNSLPSPPPSQVLDEAEAPQ